MSEEMIGGVPKFDWLEEPARSLLDDLAIAAGEAISRHQRGYVVLHQRLLAADRTSSGREP